MDKIKIAITGRVASVEELPEVVADNAEYEVDFALDPREGWDVSIPITALFVRRDGFYTARIMDAGETSCTMPPQTGTNIVFVGLTQDDMRTTTPATIKVHRSIRTVANDPLPEPSEDVYAQILAAYAGVKILSGKGAPTSETQGEVNQLYRDEDTQRLYICTSTDGGYTWEAVSGGGSGVGSVDIDATLTKAGQAADAKAAGDAIGKKIDKAQGTGNAGKILGIGADGNVTPQDKPVQALAGASAPTTATAGVVGQEYYVIVGNAVTEMYVCTAVANGTYTWGKVEFGAEESDPTVPAWAKAAQKPSYTASEVGADPSGTAASQVSAHNTGTDTHSDIRLLISGLTDRLNALADSDDTTLDQLSEVVAYIKSNRTLIEAITTNKVSVADIIDNLTTNVTNKPLSAAQGVALKALIDAITVPDKLPNPNALTFTGAVTGTYDGSEALMVEIPSGGGSSDAWETIIDTVLEQDTGRVSFSVDASGNPFSLKEFTVFVVQPPIVGQTTNNRIEFSPNNIGWGQAFNVSLKASPKETEETVYGFIHANTVDGRMNLLTAVFSSNYSSVREILVESTGRNNYDGSFHLRVNTNTDEMQYCEMPLTKIGFFGLTSTIFGAGTRILLRGIRS